METVVNIQCDTSDRSRHRGAQEKTRVSNVIAVQVLGHRSVGLGVVDGVFDEGLLTRFLSDGGGSSRLKWSGRDGVDTKSEFTSGFEGKSSGIRLKLSLGRGHTTTVSRDDLFGSNVSQGESTSSFVHDRSELLDEGNERVGRSRGSSQVSLSASLEKGLGNLRSVGERVDENVNLTVVGFDSLGNFGNGVSVKSLVSLVFLNIVRDVLRGIEDGVKRVNLGNFHLGSIGKSGIFVELSLLESHLENLQNWRPSSNDDGSSLIGKGLGNGPSVSGGISNTSNEGNLSGQVGRVGRLSGGVEKRGRSVRRLRWASDSSLSNSFP